MNAIIYTVLAAFAAYFVGVIFGLVALAFRSRP
jgi:hypothetical protein